MGNRGTHTFPGTSRSQPFDFQATGQGTLAQRPAAGFPGRLYYATDNGLLYIDSGVAWQSQSPPKMIAHSEATVTVNTTAAETNLMNATILANTLAVGDAIRVTMYGDLDHTEGSTRVMRFRFYLGASVMFDMGASVLNLVTGASFWWQAQAVIQVTSLTTQRGEISFVQSNAKTNTWQRGATTDVPPLTGSVTSQTADLTTDTAVKLTITPAVSSANLQARLFGYTIERLLA